MARGLQEDIIGLSFARRPKRGGQRAKRSGVDRRRQGMKARQMIDGASFGPDALNAMGQAFDQAWQTIAGNFGSDPHDIERARLRLATALLSVASEDSRDVEALKRGALQPWRSPIAGGQYASLKIELRLLKRTPQSAMLGTKTRGLDEGASPSFHRGPLVYLPCLARPIQALPCHTCQSKPRQFSPVQSLPTNPANPTM
jgi:hypothetical protein